MAKIKATYVIDVEIDTSISGINARKFGEFIKKDVEEWKTDGINLLNFTMPATMAKVKIGDLLGRKKNG